MKRRILAILLTLMMLFALTACGGQKSEAAMDMAATSSAPMEEPRAEETTADYGGGVVYEEGESQVENTNGSAVVERKFIITAWLELETTSFDEAVQGLTELTEEFGGYFETSSVANRKSGSRWANYTARIPADQYEAYMNQAGTLCHETWREANAEDISEAYYDTQGRLKTQQIKLERLQELLAKAELMEDIITIESAISETEWQIENLSGTLRHYDSKVDYATVNISLSEVYKLSNVETVPESFGQRLGAAFTDGLSDFGDTLEDLAVSFAYSWMWWLLLVVVVVVVVRIVRKRPLRLPRKAKKKADDKQDET